MRNREARIKGQSELCAIDDIEQPVMMRIVE